MGPIIYNSEHRGYAYEDPEYSITGLNLGEQDLQALRFATLTLLQFRDMPVFQQYQAAIGRIFERVHASTQRGMDQHVQFEQAPKTLGTEHIAVLMSGIAEKRAVRFTYRKFNADGRSESERCIEPYLLKEYRNRWYVIGKPEGDTAVKTFALDRMDAVVLDEARFVRDRAFNADRYFRNSIGITAGSEGVREFCWAAAPLLSHYLDSQPIHASQTALENVDPPYPGWKCYKIEVHPTYELNQWILGFGAEVMPLGPDDWIEQLRGIHERALQSMKQGRN